MALTDAFNTLYKDSPEQWSEWAGNLTALSCQSEHDAFLGDSIKAANELTELFNGMIFGMNHHNMYIAEHIYAVMPVASQKNLIDFALNVIEEPTGEDNYMSNYPQYLKLRAESEKFAKNFSQLPSMTQIFYREALTNSSNTIFKSLHSAADIYEHEATKHMTFNPDN